MRNDMSTTFLQHFYNNPKWQVVTSCYWLGKKVMLVLVSNLNQ